MARPAPVDSDADLVRRASKGDPSAVMGLYDRHSAVVFALCLRVLGNRDEAEDVVQEAFVRAWQDASDYDPERAGFRAWLCTIARNRALDLLRRRRTAQRLAPAPEEPDRAVGPDHDLAKAEESRRVRQALAQLPGPQREALELAYWSGLTHVQIAEKLGSPLGTVKTRIFDGMRKLKAILEGGLS